MSPGPCLQEIASRSRRLWQIERFAGLDRGSATLATKSGAIDGLLSLDHREKTTVRVSVNPEEIITYGLANEQINREAFPNAENLLDRRCMRPKGRGKSGTSSECPV